MGFFIVLGWFLDGIRIVVLTMAVPLPTVQAVRLICLFPPLVLSLPGMM